METQMIAYLHDAPQRNQVVRTDYERARDHLQRVAWKPGVPAENQPGPFMKLIGMDCALSLIGGQPL